MPKYAIMFETSESCNSLCFVTYFDFELIHRSKYSFDFFKQVCIEKFWLCWKIGLKHIFSRSLRQKRDNLEFEKQGLL